MQPEIYFHVGLGKAASTYLQYQFFPKLQNIRYVQRTAYKRFAEIVKKEDHERFLVSREFDQQLKSECSAFARKFPNARPIIIFRRHDGWIASQYRRYVKNGGIRSFSEFFSPGTDDGIFKDTDLQYHEKIEWLRNIFRTEPLVLIYEDMRKDPFSFFDRISQYTKSNYNQKHISLDAQHKSFQEKELKRLQVLVKKSGVKTPLSFKTTFGRWIYLRSKLYFHNLILAAFKFMPEAYEGSLIADIELKKVQSYYREDWNRVLEFAEQQKEKEKIQTT